MALAALVPRPVWRSRKPIAAGRAGIFEIWRATVQDGLLQEQGFNLMRDTPLHVDAVGFADLKQSPTS